MPSELILSPYLECTNWRLTDLMLPPDSSHGPPITSLMKARRKVSTNSCDLQTTWADLGGPSSSYHVAGATGRYHCPYTPCPYVLQRCPRIQIPSGSTTTIIPDHPCPVGAPPSYPLNTHSLHSLNPYRGQCTPLQTQSLPLLELPSRMGTLPP